MQVAEVEDVHEKTRGRIWDWFAHMEEDREEPNLLWYTILLWAGSALYNTVGIVEYLSFSLGVKLFIVYSIFRLFRR